MSWVINFIKILTVRTVTKLSETKNSVENMIERKNNYNYVNNFEISLVVFMPNITTNHAITYTNTKRGIDGETSRRLKRTETVGF